jgi:HTH-like domain
VSVHPFIEAERAQQHSVQRACQLLQVSRAAYYAHRTGPSARERADPVLTARIRAVHAESKGRYGPPPVHAELARNGHQHGRKWIARLMRRTSRAARPPSGGSALRSRTSPRHRDRT